jgi:PilZ domain-containing protein
MGHSIHDGGIDRFALLDDIQRCRRLSSLEERMAEPQLEKRAARRFALRIPVSVDHGENPQQNEVAQIRDVSARGICFYLDSALAQGAPIGFTLTLPPEITLTESIRVQCKGRVVRVENPRDDGKLAVAAVIEEYEFLPEA